MSPLIQEPGRHISVRKMGLARIVRLGFQEICGSGEELIPEKALRVYVTSCRDFYRRETLTRKEKNIPVK